MEIQGPGVFGVMIFGWGFSGVITVSSLFIGWSPQNVVKSKGNPLFSGIYAIGGGFNFFKIFSFYLGTVNSTTRLLVKFLVTSTNGHRPKKSIYLVNVDILLVKFCI